MDDAGIAGAHNLAEMDGIEQKSRADLVKVGVIEDVGGLSSELYIHLFTDRCVLKQGCIPAPGTRAKYRTAWGFPGRIPSAGGSANNAPLNH